MISFAIILPVMSTFVMISSVMTLFEESHEHMSYELKDHDIVVIKLGVIACNYQKASRRIVTAMES